ncbi:hypothetical protein C7T94_17705 [Pedobacter yulinensis]|uniref:Uncharacterized protein n=1 Tax=Pedobacter yulinensis TaxID=2126353 RepID=A0A2T3HGZ5_9SPHI|nr:TonB-dependent receptor [Pedobacter yulinensis]PST81710.1 hypothetical protein C7T94_17705 [Pedobacter yulinensis]
MRPYRIIYTTLLLLSAGGLANAQDKKEDDKDKKVVAEEIEVVRPYKPILAEAFKLRRSPNLDDVKTYKAKLNYSLTDRKLELNSDILKLQAQQVADEKATELVNNYLKGGFGMNATSLLEAYISNGKDEALQVGGYLRHFGQGGSIRGQRRDNQELSVFGRTILDMATVSGRLNFERSGFNFYGFNPNTLTDQNPDPAKQRFNFFEAEGEVMNKFTEDEDALSYAVKVNGNIWSDQYEARENYLTLNGYVNKRINSFNLGLAAGGEFGSTKDVLTAVKNNILRLNPYIRLQAKGVKITAGINFVQEFGLYESTRLFPAITADFTLIPDYLQIFGEVKGDVSRNSMKGFTDENPWLNTNINIKNTVEKMSISGGIKGTGGPGFGYKARFYHKTLTDMPLFVNNFNDFSRFDVIYDFGNMKLTGIEGELSVQVSNDLRWTGKLNFDNYKPASESEAWFKPQMRLTSNLLYNITDKISLNASLAVQDETKAKIYTAAPVPAGQYVVPDESIEQTVNVSGFADLGAGAEYRINKQFTVFARANNLLNNKYSKFLYYQYNGLNIFGGLTYSF